jgi:hypothetical protein
MTKMGALWMEHIDATSMTIELEGVDVEKSREQEARWFKRALGAPTREEQRAVTGLFSRRTPLLYPTPIWLGLLPASMLVTLAVMNLQPHVAEATYVMVLPYVTAIALACSWWIRKARAAPPPAKVLDRFTLSFNPVRLSVSSGGTLRRTFDVAAVDRFEFSGTLMVVNRNGTRAEVPCALSTRPENETLVERLNDALMLVRSAGAYRGVRIGEAGSEEVALDQDAGARRKHVG